jgi:Tol biopolymer transport system component
MINVMRKTIKAVSMTIRKTLLLAVPVLVLGMTAAALQITTATYVKLEKIPVTAAIICHMDGQIYTMDKDGNSLTRITFGNRRDWEHVAVSYDRRYIVANERRPDAGSQNPLSLLWIFDLNSGTEARLASQLFYAGDGGVDWDPSGFVYFAATASKSQPNDVYKIKYDGTGLMKLTTNANAHDVSVSQDGSLVAYVKMVPEPLKGTGYTELCVVKPDGTQPRMVYKSGRIGFASAHDPEISPDNQNVIFSMFNSTVAPNYATNQALNTAHDICVVKMDGTGFTRITKPGPISMIPDWRDNEIIYTEINETDKYSGAAVVNSTGTEQTPTRIKTAVKSPKWIPRL